MIISWNDILPTFGGVCLDYAYTPIPVNGIRLKIQPGINLIPSAPGLGQTYTNPVLIDPENNIWDIIFDSDDWSELYYWQMTDAQSSSGVDRKRVYHYVLECLGSNTANVSNMDSLFGSEDGTQGDKNYGCYNMTRCENLDISGTTSIKKMFAHCWSLPDDIQLSTSHIVNFYGAFWDCRAFRNTPNIDVSHAQNMSKMFMDCTGLTTSRTYNNTSNVVDMSYMFSGCTSLVNMGMLDTSRVSNMEGMLQQCNHLTSIPSFDVTSVTKASWICSETLRVSDNSGYLLYRKLSRLSSVPTHYNAFEYCGYYDPTGSSYLAQIPSDWK
jgi:hypothetical protein